MQTLREPTPCPTRSPGPNGAAAAHPGLLRVAVVGCGAVVQQFHLPVLAGHPEVQLAALVDRDEARVRQLARGYAVPAVGTDHTALDPSQVDAVLVATPPTHHAPCALALMRRGLHVLVEKPLAVTADEAEEMVRVSDETGAVLAVGLYRRLLPVTRLLRALVQDETWGQPLRVDVEWGGMTASSSATLGLLRKDQAGGGVLLDLGPHVLDQLLAVFPGPAEVLEYQDDSLGGVEADCEARLRLAHRRQPVDTRVALSRVRNLRGTVRIECERARLEVPINERYQVRIEPAGNSRAGGGGRPGGVVELQARWQGRPETAWYEAFRAEVDDWLAAIRERREPELSGRSALASLRLIDACYRSTRHVRPPWVGESLTGPAQSGGGGSGRRVLITGASGFIGTRVAEVLCLREGWQVRGLVHRPAGAARLSRLPVEMVQGDLRSPADVRRVVAGCDAVVHCAVGTEYGNRRALRAVTVGGTESLLAAAREAGVSRFVHLSSISIHDPTWPGPIDEATPVSPALGDVYGRTKAEAERAVLAAARRGLTAVVLRPGCVYGPHGFTFVVNPLRALAEGRLVLEGSADTPANTVYVDNLVAAIVRALDAPAEAARGEVFTVSDGDGCTWGDYYGEFARRLGVSVRVAPAAPPRRVPGPNPLRWLMAWARAFKDLALSAECKALLKKALNTDPPGRLPRGLLERFPGAERWLRRRLGMDRPEVYLRPEPAGPGGPVRVTPRLGCVCIDKARNLLGYQPPVSREQALELTWEWVRHARIVS
jgi:predicted dehydrogenase/nucleoside-diphosphate-sugar epimerase